MKKTPSLPLRSLAIVYISTLAGTAAHAQISKVNTVLTNVETTLTGVSVVVLTISIMWAGFKMAFQHAKWSDISSVVIGGILIGGASGIASWLLS